MQSLANWYAVCAVWSVLFGRQEARGGYQINKYYMNKARPPTRHKCMGINCIWRFHAVPQHCCLRENDPPLNDNAVRPLDGSMLTFFIVKGAAASAILRQYIQHTRTQGAMGCHAVLCNIMWHGLSGQNMLLLPTFLYMPAFSTRSTFSSNIQVSHVSGH